MANYLVTGANGGMGRAVCRALAGAGNRVWGLDISAAVSDLPVTFLQADLTDAASLSSLSDRFRDEGIRFNGIVHAAGIYDLCSFAEIPEERLLRIFNVNLFGICRVNRFFLPLLESRSRIVIISSELAPLRPLPFTGIYAVTKSAVEKYAYSLRMELQLLGHQVTVVRPGAVSTGMLPDSTKCLDRFCAETELYTCNADRFRTVVGRVESRTVPPEKIAAVVRKVLSSPRAPLLRRINRSPLLLLFDLLPSRLQLFLIKKVVSP